MTRRRAVTAAAKVVVSGGMIALLVSKGGAGDILTTLERTDPIWLALGFGLGVLGAVVTVSQWHALMSACGVHRSWWRCFRVELACDTFDAALPTSIGGDVLRAVLITTEAGERPATAGSVVLRRLLNFPGMVVVMAVGLAASWWLPAAGRARPYALGALLAAIAGAVVFASPLAGRLASHDLMQRFSVGRAIGRVLHELDLVRARRRVLVVASVRGTAFWCVVVASQWCYMRGVGVHAPLGYAAATVTVVSLITMLPISLGGYGVREGGFSFFLAVGGMATISQGVGVGLCVTAQTMAFGLLGIPAYLTLRQRRAQAATAPTMGAMACAS